MLQLVKDGVRWELLPSFAALLDPVLAAPGRVVKESPAKLVTEHQADGRTFFIKRYRHEAVPLRPLKYFFKDSQARQEWELAEQIEARGIPIVTHLALGERHGFGVRESILITEGFPARSLEEAPHPQPQALLAFVERLHEQGVLQHDLHAGNILLAASGEMRLVDLHGTELKSSVSAEERATNLAHLNIYCPLPVPAPVLELSERLRRKHSARRSLRSGWNNREFGPEQIGGLKWQVRRRLLTPAARAILADPDGFLKTQAQLFKTSRSSTVGRAPGLVLKRFNLRKVESLFKDLFRPSRARRAFRKAYHLELAGIATPRPLAAADWRVGGVLLRSYLLMEEIAGAMDLGVYLSGGRAPEVKVIRQAAALVARLHEEGFTHRDLKESNLILGADGRLSVIDLEGLEHVGLVEERRAALDLARFARGVAAGRGVTRAHRMLFLRHYCRVRGRRRVPRENEGEVQSSKLKASKEAPRITP